MADQLTPQQIAAAITRATDLPDAFRWRPILNLAPREARLHAHAYVSQALEDVRALCDETYTAAQKRKVGLALGVMRAVMTSYYEISTEDLIPDETSNPMLEAGRNDEGATVIEVRQDVVDATTERLVEELVLTEQERQVIPALHMCAIGLIAMQGWSLHMTDHHYVNEAGHQSYRAYEAVEKQFWVGAGIGTWFSEDKTMIRDVMWHKSGHPVSISFKLRMASSEAIKERLAIDGAGSAACLLPAKEYDLREANSYLTVLRTVRPIIKEYGGKVTLLPLTAAITAVQRFPPGVAVDVEELLELPTVPNTVRSRRDALMHLENVLTVNRATVAAAYGFYSAMMDAAASKGGADAHGESLRTSFSLNKLKTQSNASFMGGYNYYGDYAAFKSGKRAEGPKSFSVRTVEGHGSTD